MPGLSLLALCRPRPCLVAFLLRGSLASGFPPRREGQRQKPFASAGPLPNLLLQPNPRSPPPPSCPPPPLPPCVLQLEGIDLRKATLMRMMILKAGAEEVEMAAAEPTPARPPGPPPPLRGGAPGSGASLLGPTVSPLRPMVSLTNISPARPREGSCELCEMQVSPPPPPAWHSAGGAAAGAAGAAALAAAAGQAGFGAAGLPLQAQDPP